jgi:RNA polymerase sigma-70 factor (ECF subfamily)
MRPDFLQSYGEQRVEEFARLLVENKRRLHSYILTLVPNWADAEELEQKTAIILWQKFDSYESGTSFGAWACRIARLEINNFRRVQGRSKVSFSDDLVADLAAVKASREDEYDARRDALRQCIERLPASDGELIKHCYGSRLRTATEVARGLGKPANTVSKSLARIRRRLFDCIQRRLEAEGGL